MSSCAGYTRKQELSTFLFDNLRRSDDLGNTGTDERIILKWILQNENLNT
jgi:hypothetical protein